MSNDQYQEVLIVIITGIVIFIVLVGAIVFTMLYYQKKKFQHLQEKRTMAENYQKQLLQSRLEMQEETFNAISQEIHDNVGQLLSLAKVQLNIAGQHEVSDKALLKDIKSNIGQAMADLRDIAKSLSSDRLQLISLPEAVSQEVERICRSGLILCGTQIKGWEKPLSEQKKVILFRIIQEGLQNILKHSNARQIDVNFQFDEQALHITIKDNGAGFDVEAMGQKGLGLKNIKTRASLIGGSASIQSVIDQGTTIRLNIPYG